MFRKATAFIINNNWYFSKQKSCLISLNYYLLHYCFPYDFATLPEFTLFANFNHVCISSWASEGGEHGGRKGVNMGRRKGVNMGYRSPLDFEI